MEYYFHANGDELKVNEAILNFIKLVVETPTRLSADMLWKVFSLCSSLQQSEKERSSVRTSPLQYYFITLIRKKTSTHTHKLIQW